MTEKLNGEDDKDVANSDDNTGTATADDASEDAMFEDLDVIAEQPAPPRRPSRFTVLVANVALLASLAALAGVAYLIFFVVGATTDDDAIDATVSALSDSIRSNETSLNELQRQVSEVAAADGSAAIDVDALERRLGQRQEQRLQQRLQMLDSVPARVASLESALSALRGISTGARDAWLLAEAEYYMQIANAQLQLAGNPLLATLALGLADERLVELGDPGLTDVRRTLSDELRALEVLESPDIAGATLTLASLSRVVDSLPIRQQIMVNQDEVAEPDAELSGTDRAVVSLKNALSGIVSVRRTDEAARALIAPEAVYFLRANLALQLQAARLALLRGEQTLFQQSLDDAATWLREYYDTESTPVRSALQTIVEIRDNSFTRALPDISESLRLLRQYMAFIEAPRADTEDSAVEESAIEAEDAETEPEQ